MKNIGSIFFSTLILGSSGFAGVPFLKILASNAIVQVYDGSQEHRKAFRTLEPHHYDFSGCPIKDKNFSGESLRGAKFKNCTLTSVNLENTNLIDTDFEGATFDNVSIDGAILWEGFKFDKNIPDIKLFKIYSDLMNSLELSTAKGQDAEIKTYHKKIHILNHLVFGLVKGKPIKDSIQNLNLRGINICGYYMDGCKFSNVNLINAKVAHRQFINCCFHQTYIFDNMCINDKSLDKIFELWIQAIGEDKKKYQLFIKTGLPIFQNVPNERLKQINWKGVNLKGANFSSKHLEGIDFSEANLKHSFFEFCQLTGINFTKSKLQYASFQEITQQDSEDRLIFKEANLTGANFDSSILTDANFTDANLTKADLTEVDLTGANLKGTKLGGVTLDDDYSLPDEFTDEELLNAYRFMKNDNVKNIVKQILIGKGLIKVDDNQEN